MKKRVLLYIFLVLLLSVSVLAYNGYSRYNPFGGGGGYGGDFFGGDGSDLFAFGLMDLYCQYSTWFDFIIFLIIFTSLGKMVFADRYEQGGKSLTVGIGVFLAFALLLWEMQTGLSILGTFGPFAFLMIILILSWYAFKYIGDVSDVGLLAVSVSYLIFYFFFNEIISYGSGYYGGSSYGCVASYGFDFLYSSPVNIFGIMSFLAVIAVIGVVVGLVKLLKR